MIDPRQERNKIALAFACFLLFFAAVFLMVFLVGNREVSRSGGGKPNPDVVVESEHPVPAVAPQEEETPPGGNLTDAEIREAQAIEAAREAAASTQR